MKKIIILLLVLIFKNSFAQQPTRHIPTQFDKFIEKTEIDWASYINDTVRFNKFNLHELLRNRLDNDQIRATIWLFSRSSRANQITYVDKKMIKRCSLPGLPIYGDSSYLNSYHLDSDTSCRKFDGLAFNLIALTEILYIEQGVLKSYIPWVTPQTSVFIGSDSLPGVADYFSTSFNYENDFKPSKNDSIIYLGKTQRQLYIDSFRYEDRLKELYGRNLAEALWPYVLNNKLSIYSIRTNKKLNPDELDINILDDNPVIMDMFDSLGNIIGKKPVAYGSVLENIKKIEIVQQWYYDETRNIVYNIIPEVLLLTSKFLYERSGKEWIQKSEIIPLLKILFKNNS